MNKIRFITETKSITWTRWHVVAQSGPAISEEVKDLQDYVFRKLLTYPFQGGAMQDVAYETLESFSHEK